MTDSTGFTRRHFLTVATFVTGGAGIVATAVPFVASFQPSARAQALGAPVQHDVSKIEPGALLKLEWRGQPIYLLHRTEHMLQQVEKADPLLKDPKSEKSIQPDYAMNEYRSIRPEMLVLIGVCTHLGCAPQPRFEVAPADLGPEWPGGFLCPCHGSKFDLAGRVFKDVPAPTNLTVPPYRYVNDTTIQIGSDTST
ncbi:MAG TPA: ubiquinol-cytochrome c reductase iron-sulfur subunit [Gammaproteobacteria bacterium]|nr:ubiquinol-cytochrome c reductase iron-sulfur subunit [Gammaproteobacteria bacterium]